MSESFGPLGEGCNYICVAGRPVHGKRSLFPAPLYAGKFSIQKHEGKYWLENGDGEAMATSEAKVEAMLREFFRREF